MEETELKVRDASLAAVPWNLEGNRCDGDGLSGFSPMHPGLEFANMLVHHDTLRYKSDAILAPADPPR